MFLIDHGLLSLFAAFAEILHVQNEVVETLINLLRVDVALLRDQLDDACKN